MRRLSLAGLALAGFALAAGLLANPARAQAASPDTVYHQRDVDVPPRLLDGRSVYHAFMTDHRAALAPKTEPASCANWRGPVFLGLVVTADGEVREPAQVLRGPDMCVPWVRDELEHLGPWEPGRLGGRPVATRVFFVAKTIPQ